MTKPRTQQEIVLLLLRDQYKNRSGWLPSHCLVRATTPHGWLGTSGDRRARELVAKGLALRRHRNGYAEYIINGAGLNQIEQQALFEEAK